MKVVYEASSGLEAHMILNLLQQYRITGHIEGEYLQGGVGELQAMGYVRVLVPEQDYDEAKNIISEWEAIQPAPDSTQAKAQPTAALRIFVIGFIVGAGIMYWIFKVFP